MWYRALGCIVALTVSLLAAPLEVDAQPSAKVATIGYLSIAGGAPGGDPLAESVRQGLQDLGYVEGKTIAIVYRSAEGKPERLPALAAELAQLPVDVILAQSGQVAEAAKDTTGTIPIVTVSGADPVAIGLVASLARPGGNITGLSLMNAELAGKRLQLLTPFQAKGSNIHGEKLDGRRSVSSLDLQSDLSNLSLDPGVLRKVIRSGACRVS